MFIPLVVRLGVFLAVTGSFVLVASAWWGPADVGALVHAADTEPPAADEDTPQPEEESWTGAVRLAGTILLVAGAGLLVLALLPSRAPER